MLHCWDKDNIREKEMLRLHNRGPIKTVSNFAFDKKGKCAKC